MMGDARVSFIYARVYDLVDEAHIKSARAYSLLMIWPVSPPSLKTIN